MSISNYSKKLKSEGYKVQQWRPKMRERIFPLQHTSFLDARKDLLSFVFVREPFQRIVSCYHDKMMQDWSKPQKPGLTVARSLNLRLSRLLNS